MGTRLSWVGKGNPNLHFSTFKHFAWLHLCICFCITWSCKRRENTWSGLGASFKSLSKVFHGLEHVISMHTLSTSLGSIHNIIWTCKEPRPWTSYLMNIWETVPSIPRVYIPLSAFARFFLPRYRGMIHMFRNVFNRRIKIFALSTGASRHVMFDVIELMTFSKFWNACHRDFETSSDVSVKNNDGRPYMSTTSIKSCSSFCANLVILSIVVRCCA